MKAVQCNLEHKYAERIEGTEGGGVISSLAVKYSLKKKSVVLYSVNIKRKGKRKILQTFKEG